MWMHFITAFWGHPATINQLISTYFSRGQWTLANQKTTPRIYPPERGHTQEWPFIATATAFSLPLGLQQDWDAMGRRCKEESFF